MKSRSINKSNADLNIQQFHKNLSLLAQACSVWGYRTTDSVRFPRTSISSQSPMIHRLTSLPFQWVLFFPKDPRAEWGCRKKYPSTIKCVESLQGPPNPVHTDKPNSLQLPSASPFSHPSNLRVKSPFLQTLPRYLYHFHNVKLLSLLLFFYSYLNLFLLYFNGSLPYAFM